MSIERRNFTFLNIGHLLDHYFMLIFATAVLTMESAFGDSYGRLLLLTTWSFFFFGGASLPAGWLGDRWSRHGMMLVFFVGIGTASILTGLATNAGQIEWGLAAIGIFGAIYHPIGLALVVEEARVGRALAINGVWGNIGVALAAVGTGTIAELYGWRWAFVLPGIIAVAIGGLYGLHLLSARGAIHGVKKQKTMAAIPIHIQKRAFAFLIVAPLFGGLIFQATTISLPKIMDERLAGLMNDAAEIGATAAVIFALAALAQLVVGELLDRFPTKRIYVSMVAVQALMCVLAVQVAGWASIAVALPLMLITFGLIPINDWIVAHYISKEYRSRVFAVKSLLVLGIGAVAVQMTGRLHDATGSFDALFWAMAASAGVVLLATLILLPKRQELTAPAAS